MEAEIINKIKEIDLGAYWKTPEIARPRTWRKD